MNLNLKTIIAYVFIFLLMNVLYAQHRHHSHRENIVPFIPQMPQHIQTSEKTILVNPHVHAFGAYDENGNLLKSGMATAGSSWCPDIRRRCRTKVGAFRIQSLGSVGCHSSKYPRPHGGAPMPYCMFFNGGQGLHGSHEVVPANVSHGCVRLHVPDAEWIRFNFATIGTKVIIMSY